MSGDRPLLWINLDDSHSSQKKNRFNPSAPRGNPGKLPLEGNSVRRLGSPRPPRNVTRVLRRRSSSLPVALDNAALSPETDTTIDLNETGGINSKSPDNNSPRCFKPENPQRPVIMNSSSRRLRMPVAQSDVSPCSDDDSEYKPGFLAPIPEVRSGRRPSQQADTAICKPMNCSNALNEDSSTRSRSKSFGNEARPSKIHLLVQDYDIDEQLEADFKEEVLVQGFSVEDLRVLVGRNRVRINGQKGIESLNRVVSIPQHIDPLTVKTTYHKENIIISGNKSLRNRKWTVGRHGLMTVNQDGSVRVTLDLPNNLDLSKLHVETVTKHYLTISVDEKGSNDLLETFELPEDSVNSTVKMKKAGDTTVVIELTTNNKANNSIYKPTPT